MDFLPADIQQYVEKHSQVESDLLNKIYRETHLQVLNPRMISGRLQGRVLSMISHMINPSRILEIGTYTGYATLALAEGLGEDGIIHTIEINEELEDRVNGYFSESGLSKKIKLHIGDACDIVNTLNEVWDLVFIDADKENYLKYYELVLPKVRRGGIIIADNVLWSGKVMDNSATDNDTVQLSKFNRTVHEDPRVQNVLFPIRDGLMVTRKL